MRYAFLLFAPAVAALLLPGCGSSHRLSSPRSGSPIPRAVATDSTYGYTESRPVRVGGGTDDGAGNSRAYLDALRGPKGERVSYVRKGSCCPFSSENSASGLGLIDTYRVTYPGLGDTVRLYVNMYDYEEPKAPVGFSYDK